MADSKWKTGQSGNPNGRPPKGEALTDVLRTLVDKEDLANKLIELVEAGDLTAIKYVYDRIDGSPRQTVDANISQLENPMLEAVREVRAQRKTD